MTDASPALRPDVARAAELARSIRAEIRKVLVGQDAVVDQVLVGLFAAGARLISSARSRLVNTGPRRRRICPDCTS